jgi:hypothetical protein
LLDPIEKLTFCQFQKIFVISMPSRTDRRDSAILAAALTDLDIEFIDAVDGDTVEDRVLPPGGIDAKLNPPSKGAWRAHMNAINR